MATNPAVSLPRARAVREALEQLDLFVVSDNVISNDTINAGAQILLPASAWGEKAARLQIPNGASRASGAFLKTPGEAKPDWWIVTQVARRMWLCRCLQVRVRQRTFSASMRPCLLSRTKACGILISARWHS